MYGKLILSGVLSLGGGVLFHYLHLPLAWMLGPALVVMLMNTLRPGLAQWPRWLGDIGIMLIAYTLGRQLTADTGWLMLTHLHWIAAAAVCWFVVSLLAGLLIARFTGLDAASALLGSVPGGLAQMVYMAEAHKGADVGAVALLQTARLIVVLYAVPFLSATLVGEGSEVIKEAALRPVATAGAPTGNGALLWPLVLVLFIPLSAWVARKIKLPAGELLGPLLFVGILAMSGVQWLPLPSPLMALGQWLFGSYLGNRVRLRLLFENRKLGPLSLISGMGLVAIALGASWLLARMTPTTLLTWFLALAPGGLGEVAVTALLMGADLSHVTSYQIGRLFLVLLLAKPALRLVLWWQKHR